MKVAGSVILYNSSLDCLEAIQTYWHQVERLYVVDNSEKPDQALVEYLLAQKQVCYLANQENKGVAYALNRAADAAIADGYDYLLTMDDDTWAPGDLVAEMLCFLKDYAQRQQVGIVAATHKQTRPPLQLFKRVPFTMTSGNLLNLRIYKLTGPFRNDFFIDHVDHEYGLRLNKRGFEVIQLPQLELRHKLGEQKEMLKTGYSFISHSPIRGYYFMRNGLVLIGRYPSFAFICIQLIVKEIIKLIVFQDNRVERLRYIGGGFIDAIRGKMGKFYS